MHLIENRAVQSAALKTVRELIAAGLAGLDVYDHDLFIVDAPEEQRNLADVALDVLGGEMIRDGAYGAPVSMLQCRLPHWVRVELDLDKWGAPEIVVPLASRALKHRAADPGAIVGSIAAASLDRMIDELETRAN